MRFRGNNYNRYYCYLSKVNKADREMKKGNRYFNTSGPNIPSEHYTLPRKDLIETKVYRDSYQAKKGLKQLAYYCQSVNIPEGLYLLFASNALKVMGIEEGVREVEGIRIRVYVVQYDEEKDF